MIHRLQRRSTNFVLEAKNVMKFSTLIQPQNVCPSENRIHILSFPGSRAIELSRPHMGNIITEKLLQYVKRKVSLYSTNHTIGAIFFTSSIPQLFSNGMEPKTLVDPETRIALSKEVAEVSSVISKVENAMTIAVYSGVVDSCAYDPFATSRFRLGTESTKFQISCLLKGHLPLCRILMSQLSDFSRDAYAIARYLGVSGRILTAHDMLVMGLLTHIVEEEPHLTLADALAHTVPIDDELKASQNSMVDKESVKELLDIMDANMSKDFLSEADSDILSHPVWDQLMMVKPQQMPLESFFQDDDSKDRAEDLEDIIEDAIYCFSSDNIKECKERLTKIADAQSPSTEWAVKALYNWNRIPPKLLVAWFQETKKLQL